MGNRLGLPRMSRDSWPTGRTYMNESLTADNRDVHDYRMTSEYHNPVEKKGILSSITSLIWSHPTPPIEVKPSNARYEETFAALRKLLAKNPAYLEYTSKHPSDVPYLRAIAQHPARPTLGVFATADVPKGTLICRTDYKVLSESISITATTYETNTYELHIQDLAYYDFMPNYEYLDMDNIKAHINIREIDVQGVKYFQAITDIKKGDELSRFYGYDYWFKDMIEIHNWNVPFRLEQPSVSDRNRLTLENQLELAITPQSEDTDPPIPVILMPMNIAIEDSFFDVTKAIVLKKIAEFLVKQKDNLQQHELEYNIIKMLQHEDVDW